MLVLQLPFGLVFAWGTVVPYALREGWTPALTGAVFSVTPLGYGLGTALGGRLGDRLPPRRLCSAALLALAVGFAVAFARPSGATFVAGYGFLALGVGGGLALTGAVAAVGQAFPHRRGTGAGAVTATYAASSVLEAPVVGALVPALGWEHALTAVAAGGGLLALVGLAVSPPLPPPATGTTSPTPSLTGLASRPLLWTGFLVVFAGNTLGPVAAVDVALAAQRRGLGAASATTAVVLVAAGNTLARLIGGWASDRLGVDRPMAAVLTLEVAGAGLLLVTGSRASLLAGALAAGLALGGAGLVGRIAAEAAPDAPSTAFGLVFAGYTLAALCSPLAAAVIGLPAAWPVAAAPAPAGALLLVARGRLRRGGSPGRGRPR
ncbi:MAG TPA: MFS transporter [Candidatus Dormibacteraeota bacterium]|jgi:MFS family permease|nr:MFS transporter [Candidatus Dormibacteraeota bacterium]